MADSDSIFLPEEWRIVVGWEGIYSVSSFGKVRRDASFRPKHAGLVMKPRTDRYGYLTVLLQRCGRREYRTVHALVCDAFIGPMPEGLTRNHKDGNKKNNRADNLEYVTGKENSRHAAQLGLIFDGARCHSAKLTESQIPGIRQRLANGESMLSIANDLGVSNAAIWKIHTRISWKNF